MSEKTTEPLTLSDLQDAVKKAAAFRCVTRLQPTGGPGDKAFPPTYAGGVYATERRRIDGRVVDCVLLDSVQSQANRMEEVLQEAFLPDWRDMPEESDQGTEPELPCDLPVLAVHVGDHGWVTSLTAPHRVHDAILRDSEIEDGGTGKKKTRFRDSEIGKVIVNARVWNATAFYRYCPTALLFGTWDSTAGEGLDSAKIPRAIVSEIIAANVTAGVRTGSRIDPLGIARESAIIYRRSDDSTDWTLNENEAARDANDNAVRFGSGSRRGSPAAINHGNIPPDLARFGDTREVRKQHLEQLPDILRDEPLELRYELQSGDGELRSHGVFHQRATPISAHAVRPGGVTMEYALHTWTLSLTQLRRLRFPRATAGAKGTIGSESTTQDAPKNRDEAARAVLAALALYALALQHERGYWLRSRCELVPEAPTAASGVELAIVGADRRFRVDAASARSLLREACRVAGEEFNGDSVEHTSGDRLPNPGWEQRVIRLTPTPQLLELVRRSDARQPSEASEQEEASASAES